MRRLFVAWWWKGAWDLISASAPVELRLERDRGAALRGLVDLGTAQRTIGGLGARLRETVASELGPDLHPALDDEAWGFSAWRVCLKPLSAFDSCVATYVVREINGHSFEELSAARISESGSALLEAAVAAAPVASPRVRRGMRPRYASSRPRSAERADDDIGDAVAADERHERILEQHPEYRAAIERGEELVDGVNPRLHVAMHQAIHEQLGADDAPEVRAAFARLVALEYDEHDVIHAIADAFTRELWQAREQHRAFDQERYAARLEAVPGSPTGDDEGVKPADLPPAHLADRERARLRGLPRSTHVWEGDLSEIPAEIAGLGIPLCALWVDTLDGTVRAMRPDVEADPGALMLAAFVDAARRPKSGRAELPWRVRVHSEIASALRDALGSIQVLVEEAEELPLAHAAFDSLAEFLADPAPSSSRRRRHRRRRATRR